MDTFNEIDAGTWFSMLSSDSDDLQKIKEELKLRTAALHESQKACLKLKEELELKTRELAENKAASSGLTEDLEKVSKEMKNTTLQLVQTEKLSALGEMAAGVAHELNQPLNSIKIISQSMLRDIQKGRHKEENVGRDLTEIVNQVNKMAEIIDHMRVFSRRTEGWPLEKVVPNTVVENALKFVGQQLKNQNIELVMNLSPEIPAILGDSIRLEQVVLNLISNARIAMESSGKEKTIKITSYRKEDLDVIEVEDNGPGIPEANMTKIFEPFFTTRAPGKGTGLGLSVTRKIIEEHKGKIEVESKVGEGALFRVILPIAL
ncbi:MAG: GHKL domain-containing protein [Candidatus Riflebacteria bacterium]|nr:GHKL domain-containing protein [Candidatus Riflebacteria bacterium]